MYNFSYSFLSNSLKLVLTFKETNNSDVLASADVSVSGLGITLTYSQVGNAVVE